MIRKKRRTETTKTGPQHSRWDKGKGGRETINDTPRSPYVTPTLGVFPFFMKKKLPSTPTFSVFSSGD
jgi:hypothetical protein